MRANITLNPICPRYLTSTSFEVVEPIMRDERLCSINPYFEDGCVYSYFYDMRVDGQPILETLDGMYRATPSMTAFMEQSLAFCRLHEEVIRTQMK